MMAKIHFIIIFNIYSSCVHVTDDIIIHYQWSLMFDLIIVSNAYVWRDKQVLKI